MNKIDWYNIIYDWGWPILFFAFIGILMVTGITHNPNVFLIGSIVLILFNIFLMLYMWLYPFEHLGERFRLWIHSFNKYKLSEEESKIWKNINNKAKVGYMYWLKKTKGNDICGPWISNYNDEERELVDKIHQYYFGNNWWISIPISGAQVMYVMYIEIKDKVYG